MAIFHRTLLITAALALLAGCSTLPQPRDDGSLQREAVAGSGQPPPPAPRVAPPAAETPQAGANGQISVGTGVFVRGGLPVSKGGPATGQVTFNFENQPIQAVVKAILGDLLKKNYAIAPGVQGSITFSTAQPVDQSQALPILDTLLSWTGNAMVQKNGSYLVVPLKDAVAGNLSPGLGAMAPGDGLRAELFPLNYVSAMEMKKLLKPFARDNAFLLVDPQRNLLVMAGTPQELASYASTIHTFDVDWLKGMSVGVFSLQHAAVSDLMPQLDKMFGEHGSTPLAGMLRFIPIERTNAIVAISPQPDYLREVQQWIERIDQGGGNQPQLYVYDVKNVQADQLSDYLNQIYNGTSAGSSDNGGSVGPGLESSTLSGGGYGSADQAGSSGKGGLSSTDSDSSDSTTTGSSMSLSGGNSGGRGAGGARMNLAASPRSSGGSGGSFTGGSSGGGGTGGSGVSITSVDQNNQLLVRCRPSQWSEIQAAIQRLDIVPLQVQIETRILEVQLTGEFSFGVQWYLQGLAGGHTNSDGSFSPGDPYNRREGALGFGGNAFNPAGDSLFYSFLSKNLEVAVRGIENNGNTKVLSEPSLVVTNNHLAKIQVGDQVPVNQTYFAPGLGDTTGSGTISTLGQVQYKDTGVILEVRPRVNPGGLVYLNLDQIVSKPGTKDAYGNFPIQKRELNTQIAVQSGQTVLLGGLIQQDEGATDAGVPLLSRIPLVGRLFGTTDRHRNRSELLLLITPRVITGSDDAAAVTADYQRKFESLAPLRKPAANADPQH